MKKLNPAEALVKLFIFSVACLIAVFALARLGVIELPRNLDPLALPDLNEKPDWLTSTRLKTVDASFGNCELALRRAGIPYRPEPTRRDTASCVRSETVSVSRLSAARLTQMESRCAIVARLYMWEKHVLQRESMLAFGEPVAEVLHFGSYSCRTMRGKSAMSEHATANAFDIAGFRLKSGKRIMLRANWIGGTKSSRFLKKVRDGLCDYFNLTLSPDYNADHKDHFHVDMGWVRNCR